MTKRNFDESWEHKTPPDEFSAAQCNRWEEFRLEHDEENPWKQMGYLMVRESDLSAFMRTLQSEIAELREEVAKLYGFIDQLKRRMTQYDNLDYDDEEYEDDEEEYEDDVHESHFDDYHDLDAAEAKAEFEKWKQTQSYEEEAF